MVKLPRLYVCGPMTGLPEFNHPAFVRAANRLRGHGYTVFSPTDNGLPAHAPWAMHMRRDIPQLLQCAGVAVLPGIETSRGAQLELHIATQLGIPAASVDAWIESATAAAASAPDALVDQAFSPMTGEPL